MSNLTLTLISIVFLISSVANAQEIETLEGTILVRKENISDRSYRYVFEVCLENEGCEILGQSHGYTLRAIKGLSGGWQRRVGAPVLVVTEGVVGVGAAFVIGALSVPSASVATVSTILWGGAAAGATAPSLTIGSDSKLRWLSPRHHWNSGEIKMDIERNVRTLSSLSIDQGPAFAIIYGIENKEDSDELLDKADQIVRILDRL